MPSKYKPPPNISPQKKLLPNLYPRAYIRDITVCIFLENLHQIINSVIDALPMLQIYFSLCSVAIALRNLLREITMGLNLA